MDWRSGHSRTMTSGATTPPKQHPLAEIVKEQPDTANEHRGHRRCKGQGVEAIDIRYVHEEHSSANANQQHCGADVEEEFKGALHAILPFHEDSEPARRDTQS